jgi:hypothetical protein
MITAQITLLVNSPQLYEGTKEDLLYYFVAAWKENGDDGSGSWRGAENWHD